MYGCVYGVIFFLLLRAIYIGVFTSYPSCFDGMQNQEEVRVDCGGPCAECEGPVYEPLVVNDSVLTFATVPGRVVVLAKVTNTNREFIAKRFGYSFLITNSDGIQIGRIDGSATLPASTQKYIFGNVEILPQGIKGADTQLLVHDPEWGISGIEYSPAISSPFDVKTVADGTIVRVEGTIKNQGFADADEVEVIALLHDRSDFHDPLYAGKAVIRVRGMSENRFSIPFPASKDLVDRVDLGFTEVFTNIQ